MREKILELLKSGDAFLSGQQICEQFGVSRTAVWKVIHQLQNEGYQIEAVRNKGYHLISEPDRISADCIFPYLKTEWLGRNICALDSVDSTNNEVKRQAEMGVEKGLLVIAEEQTAGRGRRGNHWESKKGDGIFMSILLKPDIEPANASMLTLVMGMAARDALETVAHINAQIKWPNDIVCEGKKLTGILTEMSAQIDYINYIVIGIGINVHNETFPEAVKDVGTSVYLLTGEHISRAKLAAEVVNRFETYFNIYLKTQDLTGLVEEYNRHLINCDNKVRILEAKDSYTGIARGINNRGELLVETEDGIHSVISGEVSVRGVYGYV